MPERREPMTYEPVPPARRIEPLGMDDDFPDSLVSTEPMLVLEANTVPERAQAMVGIPYAEKSGRMLHLALVAPPWSTETYPLVVFIQGSAWREQQMGARIPTLAGVAERGYVVAFVEYRPSSFAGFPAQVRDVRTALRYLQEHAAELHIEPGPIALWGDSSGAHTAVLTALTSDDPYFSDEPVDAPAPEIYAVVDYYGPTDISRMNEEPSVMDHRAPDSPEGELIGGVDVLDNPELAHPTVLMTHIGEGRQLPPILAIHGSKDRLVPFGQSVMLVEALRAAGQDVTFYKIAGADHGDASFWKPATLDLVVDFIEGRRPSGH
jgi:acetyl esterase/lipase